MTTVIDSLTSEIPEKCTEIRLYDAWRQIVASSITFMIVIHVGSSMVYSSVLLSQLNDESKLKVTTEQASWIVSLVTITTPVGSLLVGPLMDRYGRKTLSIISGIPFAIGWVKIAYASEIYHFYIARILIGLGNGFSTVCLIYCSEITHPTYRPMLLGLNSVYVSFGILLTCAFGVSVPYRTQALLYSGLSILTIVLHWPLPESPYWLSPGRRRENSLQWLYTNPQVYEMQSERLRKEKATENTLIQTETFSDRFKKPNIYLPVILLTTIFFFQQLSGAYIVLFYALDIFKKINVDYEDFLLVMFGTIRFIMSIISVVLSRFYGRRILLFISGLGMSISCFVAFLLQTFNFSPFGVSGCVLVFICFGAVGFLNIPWTLIGELFPVKVKGAIGGFMITIAYVFMFSVLKIFPLLMDNIGLEYIFLIFSIGSFLNILIVYKWLPETFRVGFRDIEKYFNRTPS